MKTLKPQQLILRELEIYTSKTDRCGDNTHRLRMLFGDLLGPLLVQLIALEEGGASSSHSRRHRRWPMEGGTLHQHHGCLEHCVLDTKTE